MIDEDRLHDLTRIVPTGADRPVASVVDRGRRLRRRRQAGRAGGAVLALGLVLGGVSQLTARPPVRAASQPGPKEMARVCDGYTDLRGPEAAEGLRYLPSWLPKGQKITYASARVDLRKAENCPRVPTSLVLIKADADGNVEKSLTLEGPSPERYPPPNATDNATVELRGTTGTLVRFSLAPTEHDWDVAIGPPYGHFMWVIWTEGDGSSWKLSSSKLTPEELIAGANGLELDSGAEAPAVLPTVPDSFTVAYARDRRPEDYPAEVPSWRASTGKGDGETDLLLRVNRVDSTGSVFENGGSRLLTVRGHQAVLNHPGIVSALIWDEKPGVRIDLTGPFDDETLIRIAESLEQVPVSDKRIRD